jgi:hypothetical protein
MHRQQREFENVPQNAPVRGTAVPVDPAFNQAQYPPPRAQMGSAAYQPGQVDEATSTTDLGNTSPQHGFDNTARNQTGNIDSYGTATGARHDPLAAPRHHHHQQQPAVASGTNAGVGVNAPSTSFADPHSAQRAAIPPQTGALGTTGAGTAGANTAGNSGAVQPSTGEKIRGTLRQVVGELEGNPRKAAEGKALREGTHPVQTGPYSAGGGQRNF